MAYLPPDLGNRLRDKLPEILLEAVSVIFAVILALAVNEWREERKDLELAEDARQGMLEEIRSNRAELASNREENESELTSLERVLGELAEGRSPDSVSVDYSISLLSSAAWSTAQVTRAIHHLDYAWLARVAKLYELQELFEDRQTELVAHISSMVIPDAEQAEQVLRPLFNRLRAVIGLQSGLVNAYDEILGDESGPGAETEAGSGTTSPGS